MSGFPHHPAVTAFLASLRAAGRTGSARTYDVYLRLYQTWLAGDGVELLYASREAVTRFQVWLAHTHRRRDGRPLARTTQTTFLIAVRVLYRWLEAQGMVLADPTTGMLLPRRLRRLTVQKDHLSLQEATALVQSVATTISAGPNDTPHDGPHARALAVRNCALIVLALATGRRAAGLVHLALTDVDRERNELRVAREKGRTGRVLPVAAWAMAAVGRYIDTARPLIDRGRGSPWLFPTLHGVRMSHGAYVEVLRQAVADTIRRNPDLTDLPGKRISTHSLRVTFAVTLFANGCGIRSLNELMLHENLNTTAQYTPIPLEDLRLVLRSVHPRA
jgi:integrase/recombinase XerC